MEAEEYSRNPYEHESLTTGTHCTEDCKACHWMRLRALTKREQFGYPPEKIVLTPGDLKFLEAAKISPLTCLP